MGGEGIPWRSRGQDSELPVLVGTWIHTLGGELMSHKPPRHSWMEKKKVGPTGAEMREEVSQVKQKHQHESSYGVKRVTKTFTNESYAQNTGPAQGSWANKFG